MKYRWAVTKARMIDLARTDNSLRPVPSTTCIWLIWSAWDCSNPQNPRIDYTPTEGLTPWTENLEMPYKGRGSVAV